MTSGDVMNEARKVYLNDVNSDLYTDTALIPLVSTAYDELAQELELNEADNTEEISSPITVTTGSVTLTLPSNFVKAIKLEERAVGGGDDDWIEMKELEWEPSKSKSAELKFWVSREDEVKLLGATTDREVRLFYFKSLTPITTNAITIPIINSKRFLALKTAALAAKFIGMNMILGNDLELQAAIALNKLVGNNIKTRQARPVKRQPARKRTLRQYYVSD